ncbi:MAG: hypothetical protein AB8B55_03620 [Mariniblastus sp.]
MDDFPTTTQTTGRYRIGDQPLRIRSDFPGQFDGDWIRVSGFQEFFDYEVTMVTPGRPDTARVAGGGNIFDVNGQLVQKKRLERNRFGVFEDSYQYTHRSPTADFIIGTSSRPIDSQYNFFNLSIEEVDTVGDTNQDAKILNLSGFSEKFLPNQFTGDDGVVTQFGSLSSASDKDVFAYKLYAGTSYTIDLEGLSSRNQKSTTLTDPILRIFDEEGTFLKGDNNSGTGTNARLQFTPSETKEYFLHAIGAGGATGSYALSSPQFDDAADTTVTKSVISVGEPIRGQANYRSDVDVHRVSLKSDYTYIVESSRLSRRLAISNLEDGAPVRFLDDNEKQRTRFLAPETNDYFISLTASQDYDLSVQIVDDYINTQQHTFETPKGFFDAPLKTGAIETAGDRDRFAISLTTFGKYEFSVEGHGTEPVSRPGLTLRDERGNLIRSYGNKFQFSPQTSQYQHNIDVRSNDPSSTGIYAIKFKILDTGNSISDATQVAFVEGIAEANGALEYNGDIDYQRLTLKPNLWYRFEGTPAVLLDAAGKETNVSNGSGYFSGSGGNVHLVHSGQKSSYSLQILEGVQPQREHRFIARTDAQPIGYSFGVSTVEVYSDVPLSYPIGGGEFRSIPAKQVTNVSTTQFYSSVPTSDFSDISEIFSRRLTPGMQSRGWTVTQVGNFRRQIEPPASFHQTPFRTWAFAEELPSYLAGDDRFAGFEPASPSERGAFFTAFRDWRRTGQARFQNVAAGDGNDEGQTMIFKAALDSEDLLVFPTGENEGGDIILNTNSPLMSDLSPGKQGYFEILRAVGIVRGLKETTDFNRSETVMGRRTGNDVDSLPFLSTPSAIDIRTVRVDVDNSTQGHDTKATTYRLAGEPFYQTIMDAPYLEYLPESDEQILRRDVVTAEGSNLPTTIDLRPGGRSSSRSGSETPFTFVNSYFTQLHDAIGSDVNDVIVGSSLPNILEGRGGNDLIIGGIGDDMMMGGAGDDYYVFRAGYGADTIDEQGGGGLEVLRVEGMYDLDALHQDVSFQRLGNDLLVRLELNGTQDRLGDRILIKNMNDPASRVEALTLLNTSSVLTRLSLDSAFKQATSEVTRFRLTGAKDQYGALVTPI